LVRVEDESKEATRLARKEAARVHPTQRGQSGSGKRRMNWRPRLHHISLSSLLSSPFPSSPLFSHFLTSLSLSSLLKSST
jgi:hypothetical protein